MENQKQSNDDMEFFATEKYRVHWVGNNVTVVKADELDVSTVYFDQEEQAIYEEIRD